MSNATERDDIDAFGPDETDLRRCPSIFETDLHGGTEITPRGDQSDSRRGGAPADAI